MAGDAPSKGLLLTGARELVKLAQRQGYDREEPIRLIDSIALGFRIGRIRHAHLQRDASGEVRRARKLRPLPH
jgi:hypothetical protein